MNRTQDKIRITKDITAAAIKYKSEMVGKCFLYVFEEDCIEVIYRESEFMHLTGVESNVTAKAFYRDATRKRLQHNQIGFSGRHPYDLCVRKMSQLKNITAVTNSDVIILKDVSTNTFSYRFGLTELNFTLCLSEDTDKNGNILSDKYIARSLRVEDSFPRSAEAYEVKCILSKKNNEKLYNEVKFLTDKCHVSELPEHILNKIDDSLKRED